MISLTAYPARTYFEGDEKHLKVMFRKLRVPDKDGKWKVLRRKKFFAGYKDQYKRIEEVKNRTYWIKFYDRRSDTFETGLLDRVVRFLERKDIPYKLKDERKDGFHFDTKHVNELKFKDQVEVRQEQLEMVKVALEKKCGILAAATNAGKSEVACGVIAEWVLQSKKVPRVLFLIHRTGLVQQTAERFQKHLDVPVVMVGAGLKKIPKKPGIVVATIQTASKLIDDDNDRFESFQEKCDILFIDEFHLNKAWTCTRICNYNNAPMRIGLSGTIDRRNKAKMMHYVGMTGPILHEVKNKQLVSLGRSAKPIAVFKEVGAPKIAKYKGFSTAYREGIVKCKPRNRMVVRDAIKHLDKNRKVLVTVARIKHGIILKKRFERKIDLRVEFLSGSTALHVRKKVIKEFEKGKVAVLIASPIFDTGVDIPSISAWVNAAGGKGWELVLQRLGRVLRRKEGENKVYISDYVDIHNEYLFKHSLARIRHYLKEEIVDLEIVELEKKR